MIKGITNRALKMDFLSAIQQGDMTRASQLKAKIYECRPLTAVHILYRNGRYLLDDKDFSRESIENHLKTLAKNFNLSVVLIGDTDITIPAGAGVSLRLPDNQR